MIADETHLIDFTKIKFGRRERKVYTKIESLAESIKDQGLLNPLTVLPTEHGEYVLVAGGRRYTAIKEIRIKNDNFLDKCPARFVIPKNPDSHVTGADLKYLELIENIQREDMTVFEECSTRYNIHKLLTEFAEGDWSIRKSAEHMNISHTQLAQDCQFAELAIQNEEFRSVSTKREAMSKVRQFREEVEKQAQLKLINREIEKRNTHSLNYGSNSPITPIEDNTIESKENHNSIFETTLDLKRRDLISRYLIQNSHDYVKQIPDETFDIVDMDSPYAIDLGTNKDTVTEDYKEWKPGDYEKKIRFMVKESYRILKPNGWLFFWYAPHPWQEVAYNIIDKTGFSLRRLPLLWVKPYGQTNAPTVHLASTWESMYYARKGKATIQKPGTNNTILMPNAQDKPHPTTKPIELTTHIYQTFASQGAKIFIPYLGSGWSILAADNIGMNVVGCDLSERFQDLFKIKVYSQTPGNYTSLK